MTKTLDRVLVSDNEQVIMKIDEPVVNFNDHMNDRIENNRVGLGARAVWAGIKNAEIATGEFPEVLEERHIDDHESEIIAARHRLAELPDEQRREFNSFLNENEKGWIALRLSPQYKDNKLKKAWITKTQEDVTSDEYTNDYVGSLLEVDEQGRYVIDDSTFGNFLEWHNYELMKRQKELDKESGQLKWSFKKKITKAIKDGWVPNWVRGRIDERLDKSVLAIDDGFETTLVDFAGNQLHALSGQEEVVIGSELDDDQREKILDHEFVHSLDGQIEGQRALYSLFKNEEPGRALNEAVVEHLADALNKGNSIDVIWPESEEREGAIYEQERTLLYALTRCGKRPIDIRDFIAAHFDDGTYRDEEGRTPLEKLRFKIKEAFPDRDVLAELDEMKTIEEIHEYAVELEELKDKEEEREEAAWERKKKHRRIGGKLVAAAAVLVGVGLLHNSGPDFLDPIRVINGPSAGAIEGNDHSTTTQSPIGFTPFGEIGSGKNYESGMSAPKGSEVENTSRPDTYMLPEFSGASSTYTLDPQPMGTGEINPPRNRGYTSLPEAQNLGTDVWDEPRNAPR